MDVGILGIFQNYNGKFTDAQVMDSEKRIAEQVEDLGFDKYWASEHHFTDYAFCADNLLWLSWLAGRTSTLKLCTGAVIIPWNNPLRVVEKFSMLDHISNGRAVLGLGRGLSRHEYEHFGLDMNNARGMFDEGATMVLEALRTGKIKSDGPHFKQIETEIRPHLPKDASERFYCVGMSPDSVEKCAELGATLMTFSQKPWEMYLEDTLEPYRESYRKYHNKEAPYPLTGDLMFCHENADTAKEMASEYMKNYFLSIVQHYEIMSEHFKDIKGYDHYANAGELFREVGLEIAAEGYVDVQTWGTPDMILEKLESRKNLMGGFELNVIANYGGMDYETAENSIKLFAKEVMPVVQSWECA
jgi:alkanesulfonate monooxygenase SsuD/methylene tetrahydromethanopterin reductase-like flavin-dependent oxidoreductase (luciferase family)